MPTKLDMLRQFALKQNIDFDLVLQVFEIERARLHPGQAEEEVRREDVESTITTWVNEHAGRNKKR